MVVANNKSTITKNTRQMLANLIAMQIRQCDMGRITQWSASVASCEATRCRHRASAHAVLPWQTPWSTILEKITPTKHNFYLAFAL
jgi:hypothetical protein